MKNYSNLSHEDIVKALTAPFPVSWLRFTRKPGGSWYPYIPIDAYIDRLNDATSCQWDLGIDEWEWRDQVVVARGYLEIVTCGRRAALGMQEHTSNTGNAMGGDMLKGLRADLLKNGALAFGVGRHVREMEAIDFDPDDERNRARVEKYVAYYFPPVAEAVSETAPSAGPTPEWLLSRTRLIDTIAATGPDQDRWMGEVARRGGTPKINGLSLEAMDALRKEIKMATPRVWVVPTDAPTPVTHAAAAAAQPAAPTSFRDEVGGFSRTAAAVNGAAASAGTATLDYEVVDDPFADA